MARPAAAPPETVQARILEAAESQLRRYGPDKLTVTDIAKECGMSHPNLYRFYSCKAAILNAVTTRWLSSAEDELRAVASGPGTPAERIEDFMVTLYRAKLRKVTADPELFRLYHGLVRTADGVLDTHIRNISGIAAGIVEEGVRTGDFPPDPSVDCIVRTVRDAAMGFYHPLVVEEVAAAGDAEERLRNIIRVLLDGFRARAATASPKQVVAAGLKDVACSR